MDVRHGGPRLYRMSLVAGALILLLASAWYCGRGMYNLAVSDEIRPVVGPPIDLRLRWVELRYILYRSTNPFDVYVVHQPEGPVDAPLTARPEDVTIAEEFGRVTRAPYPPWAYVTGMPVWLAPWNAARLLAAAANVLSLAVLAAWAYRKGRALGRAQGLLLAAAVLACAHYFTILHLGQVTLYVMALLVAAEWLLEKRREALSGLVFGLAMLKPTIAAPFFLVYLARRNWLAAAVSLGYLLVTSLVIGWFAEANPVTMLLQMAAIAEQIEMGKEVAPGPISSLADLGMSTAAAARLSAILVLGLCAVTLWMVRHRPVDQLFAVAAVASVFWTHHKPYDSAVIMLMVVPLGALALGRLNSPIVLAAAAASGLLALHLGLTDRLNGHLLAAIQLIAWVGGLIVLLARGGRAETPTPVGDVPDGMHEPTLAVPC